MEKEQHNIITDTNPKRRHKSQLEFSKAALLNLQVCFPENFLLASEAPSSQLPARMSIMRFASWDISCIGSIFDLISSLALITVFDVSQDKAKSSKSSNSSSETVPICTKQTNRTSIFHMEIEEPQKTRIGTFTALTSS